MKKFLRNKFLQIGLLLFVTILNLASVQAQTMDEDIQEIPELVFRNPTLLSGTSGKEGAVYMFKNVATGFDATIKLKKFSDPAIYMKAIDNTQYGWDKAFQPEFGMNTVKPNQNWYIDFELTFFEAGTTTKKTADRFTVTSLDVDGDGSNVKEYVVMEKASSIAYSTISYLVDGTPTTTILPTCCQCSKQSAVIICPDCAGTGQITTKSGGKGTKKKCPRCAGVGKIYLVCGHPYCGEDVTAQGPVDNFTNIDTASTAVMATYVYNNKETVNFRIGAVSGSKTGGAGVRLNSLWFKAFSLAPQITLPARLKNFSAVYDKTAIALNWQTESEQNFSHFVVEKSEDGKNYTEAALVFSAGENVSDYKFMDKNASSNTGIIYYRLKTVDKTGDATYSSIRLIKLVREDAKTLVLAAYPNPAINEVRVTLPNSWQGKNVTMELVSSTGSPVQKTRAEAASQTEVLQLQSLSKGFYVIKATCNTEVLYQQIIKN